MRRSIFLLFVLTFFSLCVKAQEELLLPLNYNPSLIGQGEKVSQSRQQSQNIFFVSDTVELPFIDDFSKPNMPYYYAPAYPDSDKSDSILYSFKKNFQVVDTLAYSKTTAYSYFFNFGKNSPDSVAQPSYEIEFFDSLATPSKVTSKATGWPPYYRIFFDSNGSRKDSILMPVDTLFLEKDSATFVNIRSGKSLWSDSKVFINDQFAVNPISLGVATFDALDSTGYPYDFVNIQKNGVADRLTSKPINLNYPVADSIYFSFYYQAQGRGDDPNPEDSLILEFKGPYTNWKKVWFKLGHQMFTDTTFKQVKLAIKDTAYLHNGFRFRFRNRATLSGAQDHWHIDYVHLDRNRRQTEEFKDLTFVYPPTSMLHDYTSMPWKHYKTNPSIYTKKVRYAYLRNHWSGTFNVDYFEFVHDFAGNQLYDFPDRNIKSDNFDPLTFKNYKTDNIPFVFPSNSDRYATFLIKDSVHIDDNLKANNVTVYPQRFLNYYSYDDGTAEAAYALNSGGGKIAYKFSPATTDTITGLQIYFARQVENAQGLIFKITIWSDNNGKPGSIIYQKTIYDTVSYKGDAPNQFKAYSIDPVVTGVPYFIGFVQAGNNKINIGFDRNTAAGKSMFYNTTGNWFQTQFSTGSWMMRPVYGYGDLLLSENEKPATVTLPFEVEVYPNPASDVLFYKTTINEHLSYSVYDLSGREVLKGVSENSIEVNTLQNGIYFVRFVHDNRSFTRKFIITR